LSAVILDGVEYTVQQFHFHLPGEHRVDEKSFAVEYREQAYRSIACAN
jgi:carbonic anhydrase